MHAKIINACVKIEQKKIAVPIIYKIVRVATGICSRHMGNKMILKNQEFGSP
jgi:hypothetical protein